ncbi:MAG: DUF4169 family protein [Rhizobiaceae bacterium]|nr:DUF4169 family protein [Rhizobiaceae bacterium]
MGEVVNLRQFRKQRKRDERARLSEEHRARFGQSAAERKLRQTAEERQARIHEAHRLGEPDSTD